MDDQSRRRRQEQSSGSAASSSRYHINDPNASRRSYTTGGVERYRPTPTNTSPSGRSMGSTASYSGYYQESAAAFSQPMTQSTIPYQAEYPQESRPAQGYGAYNPSIIYNVPQAGTQGTVYETPQQFPSRQASAQSSVYETSQQFPSRQAAGLQMMPTDVAAPYFPSEPTNTAAAANLQPQTASSSTSAVYQQTPTDQRIMQQSYPGSIASMTALAQPGAEQIVEADDYNPASSATAQTTSDQAAAQMGEAYEQYQGALREIFTNIQSGRLHTASESLLGVSEWLLSKVVDLGLAGDEESLHQDRLKLWRDFNYAWLSLFMKQKDFLQSNPAPQRGQDALSLDILKKMGNQLTRLCNGIERYGLVDYECGVWEERIMDILLECLDIYESANNEPGPSGPRRSGAGGPSHGP
ncbi:hypothetical protein NUW58_g8265 [Xylaria curta]|uniref:Uncharacterized protein n=1 Tax=Xylaria curta TaxID=42375 RepID=A0ACC1N9K3_9PEZI|nr:hypothetical protein NUW58_g8265 [Xylaria curta]